MNALTRKGRSRSKREQSTAAKPPTVPDTKPREPFVDVGLQRWTREREEWTTPPPNYERKPRPPISPSQRNVEAGEVLDVLLLPTTHQRLPRRVPLSEFIPILQDVREVSN